MKDTDTTDTRPRRLSHFILSPLGRIRESAGYSQDQVARALVEGVKLPGSGERLPGPMEKCSRSSWSGMERGLFKIDGTGYGVDLRPFLSKIFSTPPIKLMAAWEAARDGVRGG
jgi:hypothetical protein